MWKNDEKPELKVKREWQHYPVSVYKLHVNGGCTMFIIVFYMIPLLLSAANEAKKNVMQKF